MARAPWKGSADEHATVPAILPFNGFGTAAPSAISCDSGNIPGTVTGTIIWTISPGP